jgi:hypothetical protein
LPPTLAIQYYHVLQLFKKTSTGRSLPYQKIIELDRDFRALCFTPPSSSSFSYGLPILQKPAFYALQWASRCEVLEYILWNTDPRIMKLPLEAARPLTPGCDVDGVLVGAISKPGEDGRRWVVAWNVIDQRRIAVSFRIEFPL